MKAVVVHSTAVLTMYGNIKNRCSSVFFLQMFPDWQPLMTDGRINKLISSSGNVVIARPTRCGCPQTMSLGYNFAFRRTQQMREGTLTATREFRKCLWEGLKLFIISYANFSFFLATRMGRDKSPTDVSHPDGVIKLVIRTRPFNYYFRTRFWCRFGPPPRAVCLLPLCLFYYSLAYFFCVVSLDFHGHHRQTRYFSGQHL